MAPVDWSKFDRWDTFEYPTHDDTLERGPKAILIFIVCVGAIVLIAVATSIICYCCAGCALYKRYHSSPHRGGFIYSAQNAPHVGLPPQWNGDRPPAYPMQGNQPPAYPTQDPPHSYPQTHTSGARIPNAK